MIVVDIPITKTPDEIQEMEQWCKAHCPNNHYYFPANDNLDESAKFWFDDEVDVFAFSLKFLG